VRLVGPGALKAGMVLASGVEDMKGNAVVPAGATLSEGNISRVRQMRVPVFAIEDPRFDDLEVRPILPRELVRRAVDLLGECREIVRKAGGPDGVKLDMRRILALVEEILDEVGSVSPDEISLVNFLPEENHWDAHALNTAILSIRLARNLNMNREATTELVTLCITHDLSLALMPPSIVRDFGRLTGSQKKALWLHPRLDAEIMRRQPGTSAVMVGAMGQHHELWGGGGYPKGLKGEDISSMARILAIVDTYAALIGERPGRERQMPHEAIEFILGYAGEYFDMDMAETFTRAIPTYFVGTMVQLSNMQKGVVMVPNTGEIARPALRVLTDPAGQALPVPQELDLKDATNATLMISAVVDE
jgi:response regulator RpfG family c-di-GMP phosphodiesterase